MRLVGRDTFRWLLRPADAVPARFVIEGEVVVLGKDGISDFDALHSRKYDKRAQLYAFTCSPMR